MGRIAQEGPPLHSTDQSLGDTGHVAPRGDQPAHVETPVGIEVVQDPVIASHGGKLGDYRPEMRHKIVTGARQATVPEHLARRDHTRGQECPDTMTDVFMLPFLGLACIDQLGVVLPLEHLHAGLFVDADDENPS